MFSFVPDFELYPSSGVRSGGETWNAMGYEPLMELLFQNGQVVTQTQNQRSWKNLNNGDAGGGYFANIPFLQSASTSHAGTGKEVVVDDETGWMLLPQQQQVFGQDDDLSNWLQCSIDDLDYNMYAQILSSPPTPPPPHPEFLPPPPPPFTPLQPQYPPQNYLNFSSVPSSSMQAPGEYKRVDSTEMLNPTVVQKCMLTPISAAGKAPQFYGWNVGGTSGASTSNAGKNIAAACELTVTASLGASSASGEATVHGQTLSAVEERKRRDRKLEKNDCQRRGDDEPASIKVKKEIRKPTSRKARAAEVHNLSERRRRDKISSKLKQLKQLVPNSNKVDKASMLDEAIVYLKSLQLQVGICTQQQQYMAALNQQMMGMGGGDMGTMNHQMLQYQPPGFSLQAGGAASSFPVMQAFPVQPVYVSPPNTERIPPVSIQQYSTITSLPVQQGPNQSWLSTPSEVDPYQHLNPFLQPQMPTRSYVQTRAVVLPTTTVPSRSSRNAWNPENQKTG